MCWICCALAATAFPTSWTFSKAIAQVQPFLASKDGLGQASFISDRLLVALQWMVVTSLSKDQLADHVKQMVDFATAAMQAAHET